MINGKSILVVVMALFFVRCDNRSDGLKEFNDTPTIKLKAQRGGEETQYLIDSVKLSLPAYKFMPLNIHVSDPNQNIKGVTMAILTGGGYLQFIDEKFSDTVRIPESGNGIYRFYPASVGTTIVRFVVHDMFDARDSATLQVFSFSNLPPVAALEVRHVDGGRKFEYLFDASASFDADRSFGGVITKYIFSVNNQKVAETTTPAIPYIFPEAGNYTVKIQVVDNDGANSKEVTLPSILIN